MSDTRTFIINCSQNKHPNFRLVVDSAIPQSDVDAMIDFLKESVQSGKKFGDGETIDFGSMLIRLVALNDDLALQEPDLRTIPISWTEGITNSMKLLRLQKDIGESVGFGDELNFPSIRYSLLVGADWTERLDTLVLERSDHDGLDSGWFVGQLDTEIDYNNPSNLRRISVYQAILDAPHIAGFLALPTGCCVEISGQYKTIFYNGQYIKIKNGSYMDKWVHAD